MHVFSQFGTMNSLNDYCDRGYVTVADTANVTEIETLGHRYKPYFNPANSRSELRWLLSRTRDPIYTHQAIYNSCTSYYELYWQNHRPSNGPQCRSLDEDLIQSAPWQRSITTGKYCHALQTTGITFKQDFFPIEPIESDLELRLTYSELMNEVIWACDAEELEIVTYRRGISRIETETVTSEWASDNLTQCNNCDNYQISEHVTHVDMYTHICTDCRDEHYTTCESCDDWIHNDYTHYHEPSGESLCESCHESRVEDESENAGYYQPAQHERYADWTPRRKNMTKYDVPVAIEIEGESNYSGSERYDALETLIDNMTTAAHQRWDDEGLDYDRCRSICSSDSDGSLTNSNGFELTTQYLRFETIKAIFASEEVQDSYRDLFDRSVMRRKQNIGLHASFPRSAVTMGALKRMNMVAEYIDTDEGEDAAMELFGRQPSSYCNNAPKCSRKVAKGAYDGVKTGSVCIRNKPNPNGLTQSERYGRVEIRFPRSHHDPIKMFQRIETTLDLIQWAIHQATPNAIKMTPAEVYNDFKAYLDRKATKATKTNQKAK
jgi:hypothetical protein